MSGYSIRTPPPKSAISLIDHLDHLVLTCVDVEATQRFYVDVLQMKLETFGDGRMAFRFGNQKINVHVRGKEYEPKAHIPAPGALDLCFIAAVPLDQVIERLGQMNVPIIDGPVERTSATHKLRSVYVRDPDFNLIEISETL
ncbi:biphenyl-2,3-diol 1,2-dioxygenase III-like protein [Candidatus Burkholderia humilis]|nr:biphenyl-2,3-diol 1,2-dioxygenase III-like protein [Candidatus Burkholderia humilis]